MRVLIAHESSKAREALIDVVTREAGEYLEILTAGDGAATLDLLLQEDPPEVALVDWDLPGIEGPEMCRLVRDFHHGSDSHLVILASSRHDDTVDAWRAGAGDCISTPAPAEVLWAAVEKGLHAAGTRTSRHVAEWAAPDSGPDPDDDGPATLDALRTSEGYATDYFGFGVAETGVSAGHDLDAAPHERRIERREAQEPRGAALLQAVLGEF